MGHPTYEGGDGVGKEFDLSCSRWLKDHNIERACPSKESYLSNSYDFPYFSLIWHRDKPIANPEDALHLSCSSGHFRPRFYCVEADSAYEDNRPPPTRDVSS